MAHPPNFLFSLISYGYLLLQLTGAVAWSDVARSVDDQETAAPAGDELGTLGNSPSRAQLVIVSLPITGNVERRLIAQLRSVVERFRGEQESPNIERVIVLEFDSTRSDGGTGSEFEDCLKLARFLTSPSLNGIKTVAYLPQPLKGHALLVVMACEQVVMSPEGSITGIADSQAARPTSNPHHRVPLGHVLSPLPEQPGRRGHLAAALAQQPEAGHVLAHSV